METPSLSRGREDLPERIVASLRGAWPDRLTPSDLYRSLGLDGLDGGARRSTDRAVARLIGAGTVVRVYENANRATYVLADRFSDVVAPGAVSALLTDDWQSAEYVALASGFSVASVRKAFEDAGADVRETGVGWRKVTLYRQKH